MAHVGIHTRSCEDLLEPFKTLEADLLVLNQSLNSYLERTCQVCELLNALYR